LSPEDPGTGYVTLMTFVTLYSIHNLSVSQIRSFCKNYQVYFTTNAYIQGTNHLANIYHHFNSFFKLLQVNTLSHLEKSMKVFLWFC